MWQREWDKTIQGKTAQKSLVWPRERGRKGRKDAKIPGLMKRAAGELCQQTQVFEVWFSFFLSYVTWSKPFHISNLFPYLSSVENNNCLIMLWVLNELRCKKSLHKLWRATQVYGILITKQEVLGFGGGTLHFMRYNLNKEEAMGGGGKNGSQVTHFQILFT